MFTQPHCCAFTTMSHSHPARTLSLFSLHSMHFSLSQFTIFIPFNKEWAELQGRKRTGCDPPGTGTLTSTGNACPPGPLWGRPCYQGLQTSARPAMKVWASWLSLIAWTWCSHVSSSEVQGASVLWWDSREVYIKVSDVQDTCVSKAS